MLSGCGAIFNGTRQNVLIESSPVGASVFINNQSFGSTPATARLKRSDSYHILIEMPGYTTYEITMNRKISNWFWASILAGGVIGVAVDALSGCMYRLDPETVIAALQSGGEMVLPAPSADTPKTVAPADATTEEPETIAPADTTEPADTTGSAPEASIGMKDDVFYIMVVMEPQSGWEKIGQMTPVTK
jgi:hypothetical protein